MTGDPLAAARSTCRVIVEQARCLDGHLCDRRAAESHGVPPIPPVVLDQTLARLTALDRELTAILDDLAEVRPRAEPSAGLPALDDPDE